MRFGTYMGIFWIAKFILFPLGLSSFPFLIFLFLGFTVTVPFLGYYFARIFRDRICKGYLGFLHSWVFLLFMYVFAALLTAVAHYIYFRYIDNGFIINTYSDMVNTVMPEQLPGMEGYIEQIKEAVDQIRSLSPIEITLQLMSQNIFYCSILALITAPFVMRKPKTA